jgi:ATP adenylyltransferase
MDHTYKRMQSRFDWIIQPHASPSGAPWDQPLAETANFVAIPSLGSLVPGWVLIVPRRSVLNLALLSPQERMEIRALCGEIAQVLTRKFKGDIFEFEHGPSQSNTVMGCGVDQAHLHVVPLPFNLVDAVCEVCGVNAEASGDPWQLLERGRDYWIARDVVRGVSAVAHPADPVSQGIRRLIADRTGQPASWDYRTHPRVENIEATLSAFLRATV